MSCGTRRHPIHFFTEQGLDRKYVLSVIGSRVYRKTWHRTSPSVNSIPSLGPAALNPYLKARGWSEADISFFGVGANSDVLVTDIGWGVIEYRKIIADSSRKWYSDTNYGLFHTKGLRVDKDLWLCEGVMGLARLRRHSGNCSATIGSKARVPLKIDLGLFKKRKILVLDDDNAGWNFLQELAKTIPDVYAVLLKSKDTDECYNEELKQATPIPAARLLSWKLRRGSGSTQTTALKLRTGELG